MPADRRLRPRCATPAKGTAEREILLIPVERLRPTQMAVGMRAVTYKRKRLEDRVSHPKQLERALRRRAIPAVLGPGRELFIIDHHHFGLALWQAEVEATYVDVIEDRSGLSLAQFWRRMEAEGRLYPFDEEGQRIEPGRLPPWLHGLRHDPYRDLAWGVREAGGFRKVAVPYVEFQWSNYFRQHIALRTIRRNYDEALARSMKLCRAKAAAALPGFIDRHA